jgi:hypothetical protein
VDEVNPEVVDTNVEDELSRNVYDETEGMLRKRLSRDERRLRDNRDITYLELASPKTNNCRPLFKPLFFCLVRFTKGSRVGYVATILVQALRHSAQILLLESPTTFEEEIDLWGIGAFWVGHWDEAVGDGDPEVSQEGYIL